MDSWKEVLARRRWAKLVEKLGEWRFSFHRGGERALACLQVFFARWSQAAWLRLDLWRSVRKQFLKASEFIDFHGYITYFMNSLGWRKQGSNKDCFIFPVY